LSGVPASPKQAAPTPAAAALARLGIDHRVVPYDRDPAARSHARSSYGLEAAQALGIDARQVHKTLVAAVDGRLVLAVVPASAEMDLKALAAALGGKRAAMAPAAAAERATGYVVGGISPLGSRTPLGVVVDDGALAWPQVYVSAGRRGLELEVAPRDLVRACSALVAPLART
jgi:Cys-tRNA(Pro)/Cys-tRNA(Cys) deacylase